MSAPKPATGPAAAQPRQTPRGRRLRWLLALACTALVAASSAEANPVRWRIHSAFPDRLPVFGSGGKKLERLINDISGSEFKVKLYEPGILFPAMSYLEPVSRGAIEAAWGTSDAQTGRYPAAAIFASVPFGPGLNEYLAWIRYGGGQMLRDQIYADAGVRGFVCGAVPASSGGWYLKQITGAEALKGLKISATGLAAQVFAKFGTTLQSLSDGEVFSALEQATIDGALSSLPAVDEKRAYAKVAKHYYFPGWHRPTALLELIVNKSKYQALSKSRRSLIQAACGSLTLWHHVEGEAAQAPASQRLTDGGVQIHRWPDDMMAKYRSAWREVAREEERKGRQVRRSLGFPIHIPRRLCALAETRLRQVNNAPHNGQKKNQKTLPSSGSSLTTRTIAVRVDGAG